MVTSATGLTGRGLRDWVFQRISAILLAAYFVFFIGYLVMHPGLQYQQWKELFDTTWVRLFSFVVLLSLLIHSWIGLWTVLTDYVKKVWVRMYLLSLIVLLLIGYVVWCLQILWGV